ncbi:acyltransferase family protein [Streptomyces sp. NPDC053367]|uniref:acyltransferase family protein n=1 Tax=Streptomyces sp. NPDC053367 TaxID=3365700 RepID=UPI0037D08A27
MAGVRSGGGGERVVVLDGLRLVAALMVVAYHYVAFGEGWEGSQAPLFPVVFRPSAYGWLGVELFFMISGFVICMSCWGRTVPEFFVSRVIRLFPAYWLAVIATTAVVALMPGGIDPLAWRDVLVNLTMLQWPMGVEHVDGVYWTLWAELRFYLLFALVVWRGVTYRRVVAFCCVWATAALLATGYDLGALDHLLVVPHCWFFIAGLGFFLIHRFGSNLLLWGIVGLSFVMGQQTVMQTWRRTLDRVGDNVPGWGVAVLITVFYVVMAGVSLGWFRRVDWRWLPAAGALTYPLYLLHESIGWEIFHRFQGSADQWVLLGVTVVGMLVLAHLVHRWVERPASRRLKRSLTSAFAQVRAGGEPPAPRKPAPREPGPPGSRAFVPGARVPEPDAAAGPYAR